MGRAPIRTFDQGIAGHDADVTPVRIAAIEQRHLLGQILREPAVISVKECEQLPTSRIDRKVSSPGGTQVAVAAHDLDAFAIARGNLSRIVRRPVVAYDRI